MRIESVKDLIQLISPETPEKLTNQDYRVERLLIDESKIILVINDLKDYFTNDDLSKLERMLRGGESKICFLSNANKIVEYFRRLSYNKVLKNNHTTISKWIVSNFEYKQGSETNEFDFKNVYKILNSGLGEPPKSRRIKSSWLSYKTPSQLKNFE